MEKSEQTIFWEGGFGDEYTERNIIKLPERADFFSKILRKTFGLRSICEFGANRGNNLRIINSFSSNFQLTGVEVNAKAFGEMKKFPFINSIHSSIQDYNPVEKHDLVFVCGVLIHISPNDLPAVYKKLFDASSRYILINEYYNPVPVEIEYRGYAGKLFKRDFGGEFWDTFKDALKLVDYGFLWRRVEPFWDNTNWWLFERSLNK